MWRLLPVVGLGVAALAACAAPQLAKVEDATPPIVRILSPTNGTRVDTATPTLEIEYEDTGTGVASVSFRALINGQDYSAGFDHHSRGASGRVPASRPLPLGKNRLVVEVPDRAGNVGRAEVTFWNAAGGWLAVTIPPGVAPRRSVELVLDASRSMTEAVGATTRLAVAKEAVMSLVDTLPGNVPMGFRMFAGCDQIRMLAPIAPIDRAAFVAQLEAIKADGGTPIVASLLQSFQALQQVREGERLAVIVTDGGESCNGSLVQAAAAAKGASTRLIVVAVDIREDPVRQAFQKLAEDTGGVLVIVDAANPGALRIALQRSVLRIGYEVLDAAGRRVAEGDLNGEGPALPLGTYEVRLQMVPPVTVRGVRIEPLARTEVQFRRSGPSLTGDIRGPTPVPVGN
jgi:hypothetical protein